MKKLLEEYRRTIQVLEQRRDKLMRLMGAYDRRIVELDLELDELHEAVRAIRAYVKE